LVVDSLLLTALAVKKLENGKAPSTREIAAELGISPLHARRKLKAALDRGLVKPKGIRTYQKWTATESAVMQSARAERKYSMRDQ
jgi:DNA-binding transcriptional regulator LsrR (DeoR family)